MERSRKEEIAAVKLLGQKMGYGNLMTIASALWSIDLEDSYGVETGVFVPALRGELTADGLRNVNNEILKTKEEIRNA